MNNEQARSDMIQKQIRTWDVLDETVLNAIQNISRDSFVPDAYRKLAYSEVTIPLAHNQIMFTPKMEGRLLQSLQLTGEEIILEIGTGTGYLTALLAQLGRFVYSVDIFEEFTQKATRNLAQHNINNVNLQTGNGALGWTTHVPYDVIVITGSLPFLPKSFFEQVSLGGRIFVILGQSPMMEAILLTKKTEYDWQEDRLFETAVPALVDAPQIDPFTF